MKISELILELEKIRDKDGDLDVAIPLHSESGIEWREISNLETLGFVEIGLRKQKKHYVCLCFKGEEMETIENLECVFCGKEQVVETWCGTLECLSCKKVYEKGTTKEEAKRLKKERLEMDRQFFSRFLGFRRGR